MYEEHQLLRSDGQKSRLRQLDIFALNLIGAEKRRLKAMMRRRETRERAQTFGGKLKYA